MIKGSHTASHLVIAADPLRLQTRRIRAGCCLRAGLPCRPHLFITNLMKEKSSLVWLPSLCVAEGAEVAWLFLLGRNKGASPVPKARMCAESQGLLASVSGDSQPLWWQLQVSHQLQVTAQPGCFRLGMG